jgi:hypothetical protein
MNKCTYFSHDANAGNDPKILQMRSVYGLEGYGRYWIIVESMREQEGFRLSMQGQYVWDAFALRMQCDCNAAHKFVDDCINEFKLFDSDGDFFWSESLCQRMNLMDEKSQKARQSANSRWHNANAMRSECDRNAKKVKESKRKEKKDLDHSPLSNEPLRAVPKQKNTPCTAGFTEFWSCYPRKISKKNAQVAWSKIKPDDVLLQTMLAAIKDQKASPQWTRYGGDSIPHPATWLNGERWNDESQRIGSSGVDHAIHFDPNELEVLKEREKLGR